VDHQLASSCCTDMCCARLPLHIIRSLDELVTVAADHLLGCLNRSYRAATIGSSFRVPGQMLFSLLPHLQRRILMMFQDERIRLISRESAQYTTPGLNEEDLLKVCTQCCLLHCLCCSTLVNHIEFEDMCWPSEYPFTDKQLVSIHSSYY
jgi:hypothetical protein